MPLWRQQPQKVSNVSSRNHCREKLFFTFKIKHHGNADPLNYSLTSNQKLEEILTNQYCQFSQNLVAVESL